MYEAKTQGRNGFRQYKPGMFTSSAEKLGLEAELKRALANQEFFLCYQPQLSLVTGEVTGMEALIRWRHPEKGVLAPGSFIGLAEESGLIVPIGDWVLACACAQAQAWRLQGLPPFRIAVNISALQFGRVDFARRVETLLASSGVEPALLELELTESMVMSRSSQVLETLEALRDIGVRLSLDDFGTGFSSLGYLRSFPIHRLKIDQSFVRDAHLNPVNASIIRAIVALARSLSIEVVAEGVELEQELALVRDSGCDESQGYLHAKPMPAENVMSWLDARHARH
jgi:EAL domain-containing protein (putative c-di-GMP-specific phosphodiesterase class I)